MSTTFGVLINDELVEVAHRHNMGKGKIRRSPRSQRINRQFRKYVQGIL